MRRTRRTIKMCAADSFTVVNFLLLTVISAVKSQNDTNPDDPVTNIDIALLVLIIISYILIFSLFTLICRKCYLKRKKMKRRYSTIKLSTTSNNGNNSRGPARPTRISANAGCYDEIHLSQLGLDTNEPGLVNPNYMSNNNEYAKLREDLPQSEKKDKHTLSLENCHFHNSQHGKEGGCPRSLPIQIPKIIAPDLPNASFPSVVQEIEVETHISDNLSTKEEIDDVYSLAALSEAHYSCISLNEDNPASQSTSIAKLEDENQDETLEDPLSPADYEEFYSIAEVHQESFSESEEENDTGTKEGIGIERKDVYGNAGRSHQDRRKSSIEVPASSPSFPRLTRKRSATSSDILGVLNLRDKEIPNVPKPFPKPRVPRKPIKARSVDIDASSKAN